VEAVARIVKSVAFAASATRKGTESLDHAEVSRVNDPVAILKRDHREVADMLKTLESSKPGARRRSTVDKLTAALELHMEIEERDVYPLVERLVGEEEAKEAMVEHGLARNGLRQLRELVDEPGFGAVVSMLTAGIKHHVKEEEQEVFPELKRKLHREQLRELGDTVAAAKKSSRSRARATASR
jgi:hemerythrin-like domain-containing protein